MEEERLYTVDNLFLHVQTCDDGYDYTIFDKNTLRGIDGGQYNADHNNIDDAAREICKMHELGNISSLAYADQDNTIDMLIA